MFSSSCYPLLFLLYFLLNLSSFFILLLFLLFFPLLSYPYHTPSFYQHLHLYPLLFLPHFSLISYPSLPLSLILALPVTTSSYLQLFLPSFAPFVPQTAKAVVLEASEALGEKLGWAGIRASVESPPIFTPAQDPEEADPLPVQVCMHVYSYLFVFFFVGLSQVCMLRFFN